MENKNKKDNNKIDKEIKSNKMVKKENSVDTIFKDIPDIPDVNDGKYIKMGIVVLVIVFGLFGIWAAYAPLDSGVPLGGKVVSQANNKIIQNLEGGVVEKIFVDSGSHVKKGEILVKLSEAKYKSELLSLEANYYEKLALENRLLAENGQMRSVKFSKELNNLDSERKNKLITVQTEIFKNNISSLEKNRKVTSQKIEALNKQIENIKQTIKTKEKLLNSYKEEAKEQKELYNEKLINKLKLREVNRKIDSTEADISSAKTDIERIKIKINEEKTQLSLKEEEYFRNVKEQLRKTTTSLEDIRARMIGIKDKLKRTSIKAPVDGIVLNMRIHTIGAVVAPGKPIMEIVPDNSKLIIEARLPTQYIDYVKVGSKANMTFPAFQLKGRFIHNIEGEVIFVSADSVTSKDGKSFYTVKLIVDKEGEEILKKENLQITAGMPASVTIKIGKQTMLEYLVKPLTLMMQRAFLEE